MEKIYQSKTVIVFPRAGRALCCQTRKALAPAPRPRPALGKQHPSTQGAAACCGAGERCTGGATISVEKGMKSAATASATAPPAPALAAGCCSLPASAAAGISRFRWDHTPEKPLLGQGWSQHSHFQPKHSAEAPKHLVPRRCRVAHVPPSLSSRSPPRCTAGFTPAAAAACDPLWLVWFEAVLFVFFHC